MLHLGKRTKTEMLPIGKRKETNAAHEEKHLKAKKTKQMLIKAKDRNKNAAHRQKHSNKCCIQAKMLPTGKSTDKECCQLAKRIATRGNKSQRRAFNWQNISISYATELFSKGLILRKQNLPDMQFSLSRSCTPTRPSP